MSKTRWVLLPLIVIIFIYAILVSNGCCQQSPVVIVAFSVSSWFLTIADFCLSQTASLQDNVDDQLSATEAALRKVDNIRNLVLMRQKQLITQMRSADEMRHYSNIEIELALQEKKITRYYKQLQRAVKGNVRNRRLGGFLSACGYISLVTIIWFAPDVESGSGNLDVLTIWAFFLVLLGYFLGSLQAEQKMRQKQQSEEAILALDAMEANLQAEVIHNAN